MLLSIVGAYFLVARSISVGTSLHVICCMVFAVSLIALYASSTLYHSSRSTVARRRLRALDHASIYLLIAGTYTPFALLVLRGSTGWIIFGIAWTCAATGIILKIFLTGRFDRLSTVMYVCMGWLIVFAYGPLVDHFSTAGLTWLFAGGIAYTLGAVFYSIKRIPFGHATFHVFVLAGSICHFIAVYVYVLGPHE